MKSFTNESRYACEECHNHPQYIVSLECREKYGFLICPDCLQKALALVQEVKIQGK